ncbi:MAG: hypothetical protein NTX17_01245 [Candidatus Eisenbacteria bacterium]|nr:hypothetical protein [Candidatus Eisenbacteria bacterium]
MTKMLPFLLTVLLVGFLLVPLSADALPETDVQYKLYHQGDSGWVRHNPGDPFPSGGNVWKYEYSAANYQFAYGVEQFIIFFNSNNVLRSTYSSAQAPTGWAAITYFQPIAPNNNWKVRFRPSSSSYYIALGSSLAGYVVQFTWAVSDTVPGSQNYDLKTSSTSDADVTHEAPPDMTSVEATTWGRIKALF